MGALLKGFRVGDHYAYDCDEDVLGSDGLRTVSDDKCR